MARSLLRVAAAFAPLTVGQVDLASLGSNTACRSSTPCTESDSTSCRDKYDVMTQTTLQDCKTVCETLAASCTGIEWLTPGSGPHGRCEIWKAEIDHTVSAYNFECFEDQDNTTGTNGMLYLYFELEFPTLNFTVVSQLASAGRQAVAGGVATAVAAAFNLTSGASTVRGVTAGDVAVDLDFAGSLAKVWTTPPAGTCPLIMYAVLRPVDSDFNDGTVPITQNVTGGIAQSIAPLLQAYPSILKTGETAAVVSVKSMSRRLVTTNPSTPAPTPAPTSAPTPAPRPNTSGAPGSRCAVLAYAALATAAVMAAF